MAIKGWGTGPWGNFKWGGETGEEFTYLGHVSVGLINSAISELFFAYDGYLPISILSSNKITLIPFIDGVPLSLLNSSVIVPAYHGKLSIVLENSHVFKCDCKVDSALAVRLANRHGFALAPETKLDLTLTNDGLIAVKPVIDGQAITLVNSYTLLREDVPFTGLAITLVNGALVVTEAKPVTASKVEFIPSAKTYGWQCPTDKDDSDYTCSGKNSTDWNSINNRITDYVCEDKPSPSWSSTSKRSPEYA